MKIKDKPTIYWSLLKKGTWHFYLAATGKGLCFIGSQNKPLDELSAWAQRHFPGSKLVENKEILLPYAAQFSEYLEGKRRHFKLPYNLQGTPFQLAVWKALCAIPYGQTMTYSDIAAHIHKPAAVRAVGAAIGANPILILVPCHRVIGKSGSLTGYRGGLSMKTELLDLESRWTKG